MANQKLSTFDDMTQERVNDYHETIIDMPLSYGSLSKEQFDAEIEKSMKSMKEGKGYSAKDTAAEMRKNYDV